MIHHRILPGLLALLGLCFLPACYTHKIDVRGVAVRVLDIQEPDEAATPDTVAVLHIQFSNEAVFPFVIEHTVIRLWIDGVEAARVVHDRSIGLRQLTTNRVEVPVRLVDARDPALLGRAAASGYARYTLEATVRVNQFNDTRRVNLRHEGRMVAPRVEKN